MLCDGCHRIVDDNADQYTPEKMAEIKEKHVELIREALKPAICHPFTDSASALSGIDQTEVSVGTLSSRWANVETDYIKVRFRGALLTEHDVQFLRGYRSYDLYRLPTGKYAVYEKVFDGDTVCAYLHGIDTGSEYQEAYYPLSLENVQLGFPAVAAKAGLPRTLLR